MTKNLKTIFIITDSISVAENIKKYVDSFGSTKILDINSLKTSTLEDARKGFLILNTEKILDQKWLENLHYLFFNFPIIALSSKEQISQISLPYVYPILTPINISALFSLIQGLNQKIHMASIGPFCFYPSTKIIKNRLTEEIISLTEKESDVLEYLYANHPRAIGRDELLKEIWEYAPDLETHTLETHLYRLRKKLINKEKEDFLITLDGKYILKLE